MFLFDYSENQELSKRPRQCLPYAVVSFTPAINATAPTSISPPVSPTKPSAGLMHGTVTHAITNMFSDKLLNKNSLIHSTTILSFVYSEPSVMTHIWIFNKALIFSNLPWQALESI